LPVAQVLTPASAATQVLAQSAAKPPTQALFARFALALAVSKVLAQTLAVDLSLLLALDPASASAAGLFAALARVAAAAFDWTQHPAPAHLLALAQPLAHPVAGPQARNLALESAQRFWNGDRRR
jgi:hypothetical protein